MQWLHPLAVSVAASSAVLSQMFLQLIIRFRRLLLSAFGLLAVGDESQIIILLTRIRFWFLPLVLGLGVLRFETGLLVCSGLKGAIERVSREIISWYGYVVAGRNVIASKCEWSVRFHTCSNTTRHFTDLNIIVFGAHFSARVVVPHIVLITADTCMGAFYSSLTQSALYDSCWSRIWVNIVIMTMDVSGIPSWVSPRRIQKNI